MKRQVRGAELGHDTLGEELHPPASRQPVWRPELDSCCPRLIEHGRLSRQVLWRARKREIGRAHV